MLIADFLDVVQSYFGACPGSAAAETGSAPYRRAWRLGPAGCFATLRPVQAPHADKSDLNRIIFTFAVMNTRLVFSLLILPFLLFSCAAESAEVQGTIDTSARIAEDTQPRPGTSTPTSDDYLLLRLGSATAAAGDHVCLPIAVENFKDIIGLQYTITWDSTQLEFDKVSNFKLPDLREDGFGTRFASAGYLSSLWTEAALTGTSLANETVIYEVCFTSRVKSGQTAVVKFSNGPTVFEVVRKDMETLRFRFANGEVRGR